MSEVFTVLGAEGFVGRRLSNELERASHVVNKPKRDVDLTALGENLGHVVYCIGVTGSDFHREQFNVVEAHVSLVARILEHCKFLSFTYLSTTRTFSRSQDNGKGGREFLVDPLNSSDFYNLSKLLGEALVLNSGIPSARVARLSYVVDFVPNSTDEVSCLIRAARQGRVVFASHPDTMKNYVLLSDVVSVLPEIAIGGRRPVYEIGGGANVKMHQIGDVLMRATGCEVSFQSGEIRRPMGTIDSAPLLEEFNFVPTPLLEYIDNVARRVS